MSAERTAIPSPDERQAVGDVIDDWARRALAEGSALVAADRQPGGDPVSGAPRWYLRLLADEKEFVTVWLTLHQRTLHFETQVMPAPETNVERTFEYLLRRNADLAGMSFALGAEDAVYLIGRIPVGEVDDDRLDWIIGGALALVDECFPTAMAIGFEGRFRRVRRQATRVAPAPG